MGSTSYIKHNMLQSPTQTFSEKHQNVFKKAHLAVELTLFFDPNYYSEAADLITKSLLLTLSPCLFVAS